MIILFSILSPTPTPKLAFFCHMFLAYRNIFRLFELRCSHLPSLHSILQHLTRNLIAVVIELFLWQSSLGRMAGFKFSTSAPLIRLKSLGFLYPSFCGNLNNKPCWKAVMLLRLSIWGGRWGDMHNVCGGGGYGPYHSKPTLCIFSIKIIKRQCARSESNVLSRNYFSLPLEIILRNKSACEFLDYET